MSNDEPLYPKGALSRALRLEWGVFIVLSMVVVALMTGIFALEIENLGLPLFFASILTASLLGAILGVVSMRGTVCVLVAIAFAVLAMGVFAIVATDYEDSMRGHPLCGMPTMAFFIGAFIFGGPIAVVCGLGVASWVFLRHGKRLLASATKTVTA